MHGWGSLVEARHVAQSMLTAADNQAAPVLSWFRCSADLMGTASVRELSDHQFRVLMACMCLAGQSPVTSRELGRLALDPSDRPLPIRFIQAEVWTGDEPRTAEALRALCTAGLLVHDPDGAYRVVFRWRQYPSDNSTARTQKSRRSLKTKTPTSAVPSMRSSESEGEKRTTKQNKAKRDVPGDVSECRWCGGSGEVDGGPCPQCDGSGVAA